jgi:hypothetical protein
MRRLLSEPVIGFWHYYTSSREVAAESAYSLDETKARLLALNDAGDVYVRVDRRNELLMCATAHARTPRGTPIIPELRASLRDEGGRVVLRGQVGLHAGSRLFLAIFVGILLFLWVTPGTKETFPGGMLLALGVVVGLLVFAYALARIDFEVIARRLSEAIGRPAGVA